ncbi:Atypical kinase COQ8, mitochondrial [Mycena venus]|uniref:Atypical kinase COQ8, mitochondrial n=1 Tax=Mycena venus TaxID=2733690 RepID=A0A8H7CRP0_9AGAR|nr:Atypical kinase COQ8, mitochondrial [Mycena venus]
MPPGPVFNWLCVASSACDILVRAARVRASQFASENSALASSIKCAANSHYTPVPEVPASSKGREFDELKPENSRDAVEDTSVASAQSGIKLAALDTKNDCKKAAEPSGIQYPRGIDEPPNRSPLITLVGSDISAVSPNPRWDLKETTGNDPPLEEKPVSNTAVVDEKVTEPPSVELERLPMQLSDVTPVTTRQLQSSKVPSSRIGRLFHYGGLAASLGYGAASEIIRRTGNSGSEGSQQSVMMTEANITRLVSKLSQMRGAALKLGQFLSIQDTHVLPADVDKIFRRVQDSAHYMPDWQMEQVLTSSLGPDWARSFTTFDRVPFAAASIGQVHTAILAPDVSPTGAAARVAVKIQFPNIASSIASDLGYISLLLTAGRLLPKGLFLDRTMQVMKQELADECDYAREAEFLRAFGAPQHLGGDERFKVPWVWDGSTDRVLVMERVDGTSVGETNVSQLDQRDRDDIAARIIELCLKELFEFRMMQTDPNWSNFLWNAHTRRVELVDFGATRAYEKTFIDDWLRLLQAAAREDRAACVEWSLKLGYLTGEEHQLMLDAHVDSMVLLATPFKPTTPQPFAFGQGTQWADITAQIRAQIPVMLQHRLTPPPRETYSLNRKLSGAFLLASRLGATVDTRAIWDKVVNKYEFTT